MNEKKTICKFVEKNKLTAKEFQSAFINCLANDYYRYIEIKIHFLTCRYLQEYRLSFYIQATYITKL